MTAEVVVFQKREKALALRTLIQQLVETGCRSSAPPLRRLHRVDIGSNGSQLDFGRRLATLTLEVFVANMLVAVGYGTPAHHYQLRLRAILKECDECKRLQGLVEDALALAEEKTKQGAELVYLDRLRGEKERLFQRMDVAIVEAITASMEAISAWADMAGEIPAMQLNPDLGTRDGALAAFAEEAVQILIAMEIPTALELEETE